MTPWSWSLLIKKKHVNINSSWNFYLFIFSKNSAVNYHLTVSSNYPWPFWLTFHIFPSINSSAKSLHIEQFQQIVFIFSQRSNPNRRFHLFSFRESVFSGIFSGTGIVWKGVSFCTPSTRSPTPSVWSVHWCETMSDYFCCDSDRFNSSDDKQEIVLSLEHCSSHWWYLSPPYCQIAFVWINLEFVFATVLSLWLC